MKLLRGAPSGGAARPVSDAGAVELEAADGASVDHQVAGEDLKRAGLGDGSLFVPWRQGLGAKPTI